MKHSRAIVLFMAAALTAAILPAQSILTVAGGGTDDGRPAIAADLNVPIGVATSPNGDLYIADWYNHRIRKVDALTGIITTFAGNGSAGFTGDGGPATQASIKEPMGVAFDGSGNLYIADQSNYRVRRVDARTGVISTIAGNGGYGFDGDGGPATAATLKIVSSVAIAPSGDVYFVDAGNNRVRKVSVATGVITTVVGSGTYGFSGDGGPATAAAMKLQGTDPSWLNYGSPPAIVIGSGGVLYISDTYNNRVRMVDGSGTITTLAGNGSPSLSGDGGPAIAAGLSYPTGMTLDNSGNLLIGDAGNNRVRRIALSSGIITTVAGTTGSFGGDGGPATAARMAHPCGVALNSAGDLFIADAYNDRIRRVAASSGIISTYAGLGVRFSGDGGAATSALVLGPAAMAFDASGAVIISEYDASRLRRLAQDGTISTIAGMGKGGWGGDGGPATQSYLNTPGGVVLDSAGNIYFADLSNNRIRRIAAGSGIITTVAGTSARGYSGDNGLATAAMLNLSSPNQASIWVGFPSGVVIDSNGDLYFSDSFNYRIRKVAMSTQIITTVAGSGTEGFAGDAGPATAAQLDIPTGLALDRNWLYVADTYNHRIRRIDLLAGTITTFAGSGGTGDRTCGFGGDGGPAAAAGLCRPTGVAVDAAGSVFIADTSNLLIRKITSGTITTIAGGYTYGTGFTGDGGRATAAGLSYPYGVAVDKKGSVYIADTDANRVRVMYACVTVAAPTLTSPANGATGLSTAPSLNWSRVDGAFRYDVYVGTTNPPPLLAPDVTSTTFTPSNLVAGVAYYWKIVAKGDAFCTPASTASSGIRSFTTTAGCSAPATLDLSQPPDNASGVGQSTQLTWQAAVGAGTYDVYFGPSNPPQLLASGITGTTQSVSGLANNTAYYWSVTGHAACDATKVRSSEVRSFRTGGSCAAAGSFNPTSPASGAAGISLTTTLQWTSSANASSYDVYLGLTNPPPVYLVDVARNQVGVSGLAPSHKYYWRVIAKVACDATKNITSPVSTFTTASLCAPPGAPSISFVPPGNVGVGQTYTIAWQELPELDEASFYVVERSTNTSFSPLVDVQQTFSTSTSFVANSSGTFYHRVRAVHSCDPSQPGPYAAAKSVNVVTGTANVVFTMQPQAVVTSLGERLEDRKTTFTLENLGTSSLQVIVGKGEINSVPFFTVNDPLGGDSVFVTLEPRKPKTLEIHYSGPANDQSAAYQGIVFVAATGQGLTITPYAFVNLKVGGGTTSRPTFLSNGSATEYAFFPGFSGDDASRPPISIDVRNNGSSPMELGAEIGPEVWLVPESGWNATPIAAGTSRTIQLKTQRNRAPNGSALPRYTYFTVRSKSGETARLLVQDNEAVLTSAGRTSLLDPGSRSYVVPGVVSTASAGAPVVTRLRLTNIGSEAVQVQIYFTPAGFDGFDLGNVKRATVVVPPNDVVTLTDPLVQVFGLSRPAEGQIEVRAAPERIGFLLVSASVVTSISAGGFQTYQLPTLRLGEGARVGSNQSITGLSTSSALKTTLILTETSGTDAGTVRTTLYDGQGSKLGEQTTTIRRYGQSSLDLASLSSNVSGGRVEIAPQSGGGSIAGVVLMLESSQNTGATMVSQASSGPLPSSLARIRSRILASSTSAAVAPVVLNGPASSGSSTSYRTCMGFTTSGSAGTAVVTYRPSDPTQPSVQKNVSLFPNLVLQFDNVFEQLFGLAAGTSARGSVYVGADSGTQVYARLLSSVGGGPWKQSGSLPLFPSLSEVLTSFASRRPLYLDGLEQSIDSSRGTRWSVILNETTGNSGTATVRLYEAGNRSVPIAEKTYSLRGWEQIRLDTVFSSLGLDTTERRKDRTNVLCVVTPESGSGVISAVGVAADNATGDTNHVVFSPSGGVPATGVVRISAVTPVTPPTPPPSNTPPSRRRAVNP